MPPPGVQQQGQTLLRGQPGPVEEPVSERRGLAEQKAAAAGEAEDFRAVAPPVMSFASGRRR